MKIEIEPHSTSRRSFVKVSVFRKDWTVTREIEVGGEEYGDLLCWVAKFIDGQEKRSK